MDDRIGIGRRLARWVGLRGAGGAGGGPVGRPVGRPKGPCAVGRGADRAERACLFTIRSPAVCPVPVGAIRSVAFRGGSGQ
jgi:hypothetical protein